MDGTKLIKKLLVEENINGVELAKRLGCRASNVYNKFNRNNLTLNDIEKMAAVIGYRTEINFIKK